MVKPKEIFKYENVSLYGVINYFNSLNIEDYYPVLRLKIDVGIIRGKKLFFFSKIL